MSASPGDNETKKPKAGTRVYRMAMLFMAVVMTSELVILLHGANWMSAFLNVAIMVVIFTPALFRHRLPWRVPLVMQLIATIFLFATLFLGEMRGYYQRFWWWDIALHTSSGLVLGLFGFLLVYVMNQNRAIGGVLRPRFLSFFAFCFAVATGALWECFEFFMDQTFGLQMQKPMLGDASGLTDTMWDLIVDAIGALFISVFGGVYLARGNPSFIEVWIDEFAEQNPHLFRH